MAPERAALRIGEVARRTGVGVATLRAWERRYALLEPTRTDGGHRLYSVDDVARVRAVQQLVDQGWAVGAAADAVRETDTAAEPAPVGGAAALVGRLQRALDTFDEPAAEATVDDALARFDPGAALDEVILPVIRWVALGWEEDDRVIAREHLATNVLRPRLQRMLRVPPALASRRLIAAAPEHEEHDLGLLAASVVAATGAGWRVHFLGSRTPSSVLARATAELEPEIVLVGAVGRGPAERFLAEAPDLAGTPLVLGGAGFTPDDADALPHAVVHQGPIRDLALVMELALERCRAS